jgi:hypothetical protein
VTASLLDRPERPAYVHRLDGRRVVVTGGDGYLGRRCVALLRAAGADPVSFDHPLDVLDREAIEDAAVPGAWCLHLAAHKHAPAGEDLPATVADLNVRGAQHVAETFGDRVVIASTCKAADPMTVYGASKLIAERIVLNSGGRVARLVNVLGSSRWCRRRSRSRCSRSARTRAAGSSGYRRGAATVTGSVSSRSMRWCSRSCRVSRGSCIRRTRRLRRAPRTRPPSSASSDTRSCLSEWVACPPVRRSSPSRLPAAPIRVRHLAEVHVSGGVIGVCEGQLAVTRAAGSDGVVSVGGSDLADEDEVGTAFAVSSDLDPLADVVLEGLRRGGSGIHGKNITLVPIVV